jgi:hypothetical protein
MGFNPIYHPEITSAATHLGSFHAWKLYQTDDLAFPVIAAIYSIPYL